jgi:uncharacterized protein (DUF2235 family)
MAHRSIHTEGALAMPRNIIVCCDGTNNEFGSVNTNVVRVVEAAIQDDGQLVYYDPGVGTLAPPGKITGIGKAFGKAVELAFATDLTGKVSDAYGYLMNMWQPDDRIYIFGFSRGSYTARVVAGLLHHIGLLPRGTDNLIPYAMRLLQIARKHEPEQLRIGDRFRMTFARTIPGSPDRRCPIRFVGVWDTVSSVGWIYDPAKYAFTATNPGIGTIRHAISVDEHRAMYRQNRFYRAGEQQDLAQLWFPGVHSDVGGGYNDSKLWRCAFDWLVAEAEEAGLRIDHQRLAEIAPPIAKPWLEKKHDELRNPAWWPLEFIPKEVWDQEKKRNILRPNLFRHRDIKPGELVHETALRRIHDDATYNPPNLDKAFCEHVRGLAENEIPPRLAYFERVPAGKPVTS